MKRATPLFIAFTVVALAGLAGCGSGSSATTTAPVETATSAATTTTRPASATTSPAATTGRPAAEDLTWDDIPVYAGAGQIQKGSWSIPPSEGDYSKFEWRYYESSDGLDKVGPFYRREMPAKGWTETAWIEVQGMVWGSYTKNGENDAAMVWTSSQEGKTVLALWRGTR